MLPSSVGSEVPGIAPLSAIGAMRSICYVSASVLIVCSLESGGQTLAGGTDRGFLSATDVPTAVSAAHMRGTCLAPQCKRRRNGREHRCAGALCSIHEQLHPLLQEFQAVIAELSPGLLGTRTSITPSGARQATPVVQSWKAEERPCSGRNSVMPLPPRGGFTILHEERVFATFHHRGGNQRSDKEFYAYFEGGVK